MSDDLERALASLRREQASLLARIKSLEDQRRLHEKLGYSRYYIDMQLQALRGELALCQFHLRSLEGGAGVAARLRRRGRRAEAPAQNEVSSRYLLPVIGAFIVSVLALSAAVLLWYQRVGLAGATPTPTAVVTAAPTATVAATVVVPSPTAITLVYAVVTSDAVNVRRAAGTEAPVLGILAKGTVVQLAGDQMDAGGKLWYRIQDSGWIAAELVQVFATKPEAEEYARGLRP